ncbi:family 43 glycosylhydrolase [Streptomyces boluensis]|uniref:Family 43 glycosylhydrolase n=1 Tax=Streptomyces boluensis TaxID=1775135 RepID=A0A964XRJ1_9ACTN|nr:family 43 glycosylhydrolase [Streptomyces boluensis]NBE57052.1 family 43 glycosylhydrolase [Streptomyces boluensis]
MAGGVAVLAAVFATVTATGTATGTANGTVNAVPKSVDRVDARAAVAGSSSFPLADPDTVRAKDGRYVTYGTTVPAGRGKRCAGATGKLYVPVLVHGSGNAVGMTDCASGDVLPGGPGSWAEPGGAIWAPGVARHGDRYFMYYTASRKGSGQKCVGRAVASSARGPFRSAGVWACPPGGRWALDANPFTAGGSLYVTYRDDAITAGAETGISAVRTDSSGRAVWSTRRSVLTSTDIGWDTRKSSGSTHVVENPSMARMSDGRWYLLYSGNNWDSARYATGIADCGTTPLPGTRCEPLRRGAERPYFGYTGTAGLAPYRGLPQNHRGPGGMDVFTAADGSHRVVWHWWDGGPRHPMTGVLSRGGDGFYVR